MKLLDKAVSWLHRKGVLTYSGDAAEWYRNNGFLKLAEEYGSKSYTGKYIDTSNAMQAAVVYACVRNISEDVGTLPAFMFRRTDVGREKALFHPVYPVIHDMANPDTSAVDFRSTLTAHVALTGNAYAEIVRSDNKIVALWQLDPSNVTPKIGDRNRLYYEVRRPSGKVEPLQREQIFHLRGFGWDGIRGYSIINHAKQTIGTQLSAEEYAARFFAQDATPPIYISFPPGVNLGPEGVQGFKEAWKKYHQGANHWHEPAVLQDGAKVEKVGLSFQDAQFLEQRKFGVLEICRLFRMPPHKVADLDRATFTNIEEQNIQYYTETLRPWLVRWEQAIYRCLLNPDERSVYYAEHSIEGFLRGNFYQQAQAIALLLEKGVLNVNEARELYNRNPVEGGDRHFVQLNRTPLDAPVTEQPQKGA